MQAVSEERRIVVVGGGPAAKAAAGAYREAGGRGEVTIIAAEGRLPYERPPLSKEYLRGEMEIDELALESSKWYRSREINVVLGTRVSKLDLERGSMSSEDGRRWEFDLCLLATGAHPLLPDLAGVQRPQVHQIRTVGDSDRLADLDVASVLVLGSGFIGCEVAASLAMRGGDVTIASLEASPQVERLGEKVSERIAQWLEGHGVTMLAETELAEIASGAEGRLSVRFADGRSQDTEAVLAALGISRNTGLAEEAGVEVDGGVLVDEAMRSSHPRLLAAGDVAFAHNFAAGRRLRVEHWGEALNQGEVAGRTMAGVETGWGVAPGFWSTIGERTMKYAGWGDGWDEMIFEDGKGESFTAWYGRDREIVGVLAHDRDEDFELGRRLVRERAPWS